jgi:hypothetical protein
MGGFDGSGMNQGGRNSFDAAGYGSSMGGGWSRGPGTVLGVSVPGGLGGGFGGGISSSLGARGGTPPGMHAAAGMGQGRARRSSFEYGMGGLGGPSALQMLQGAGGTAGYPGALGPGGFDVSTAENLDQQLQLLMQITGTAGDPAGAFGGLLGGLPGGQPGTPPPAGGLRGNALVPGSAGGLFSPPMSAAAAAGGGPLGALAGLSTTPGGFMPAQGGNPALFGGNAAAGGGGGGGMFSPSGLPGMGGGFMGGAAGGMAGFGEGAGGHLGGVGGAQQRQVLVTGLPPGLNDANLRALFEICGPLGAVSKKPEQVRVGCSAVALSPVL